MVGEEKRHQMMQNLFGDQSEEEEEEEEEVASDQENHRPLDHASDEEGDGEADVEGEGEVEAEGQGEADNESGGERPENFSDQLESEGERVQSSQERDISGQQLESDEGEYVQRVVTSGRREIVASGSERSEQNNSVENEDEEVDQGARSRDENHALNSAAEIRDVFGDSDEDEPEGYGVQINADHDSPRSPVEYEESDHREIAPEDMVPEEDEQFGSDEENFDRKPKEKPVGPPLDLEIPLRPAPAQPDKMNLIRVSNIMGIEPKPFDPKTYVEEDTFVTDESGSKKRIRLEDNIVRWRSVRNRDGTVSHESNARFVKWSDGSIQLLIGNEVLDISVQDARHDQTHLFLRHDKGILQSQGRLLQKMRFMPSSLSSKSHRLLTALVDSRHKKVYKVKNCITNIDPEKEKDEKEKALNQTIRSREDLLRKQEKISRKYAQTREKDTQLSPGYLEEALEEEDELDDYPDRRRSARSFEEELEVEGRAERRILNAKRPMHIPRSIPQKPSRNTGHPSRHQAESSESEREASEYETDDNDHDIRTRKHMEEEVEDEEMEEEREQEEEEEEEEAGEHPDEDVDETFTRQRGNASSEYSSYGQRDESDREESVPKRAPRRRIVDTSDEED